MGPNNVAYLEIGTCCPRLAYALGADASLCVETPVGPDGEIRPYRRLAWHFRRRGRAAFMWVDFCPFCGAALRRGGAP